MATFQKLTGGAAHRRARRPDWSNGPRARKGARGRSWERGTRVRPRGRMFRTSQGTP